MTNLTLIQTHVETLWESYAEIFPKLVRFDAPKITINNRFSVCAGLNYFETNEIQLGGKFLLQFPKNMIEVILPHEIAHQIDFNLNGWYNRKQYHGKAWIEIMVKTGQNPNPYHSMLLKKKNENVI
jgi:predicted SprT family Zn-dependent metalloprotease